VPSSASPSGPPIRIGAVFPISGSAASLASQELRGVRIAADLVNAAGGVGVQIVARISYDLVLPGWPSVMGQLAAAKPDVIILASHIPDGVAFRQAMITAGLHVGALIGSTMAECDPDFAGELGADAVGVFASDRPTGGFQPTALGPAARATYDRFAAAWDSGQDAPAATSPGYATPSGPAAGGSDEYGYGSSSDSYAGSSSRTGPGGGYSISGPEMTQSNAGPTEEGISGFSAAWALFNDVMPLVPGGSFTAEAVAAAARTVDLLEGALPNGAGLRFSSDPAALGQNERAAAVIWQWQAVRSYTFVWPPAYATGTIGFVPLDR
jgi:hypothetical protein